MSNIVVTEPVLAFLGQLHDATELRDSHGNVVGHFVPSRKEVDPAFPFELEKAKETLAREYDQGRPLSEILARLRSVAPTS